MDFLGRLKILMEKNGDNNSTLAKKSGIPYTTIDGLFKRGWEKAQLSTIQKICQHYGVLLDYMVYGAEGLSHEGQEVAAKYETLDSAGKELLQVALQFALKHHANNPLPIESTETVVLKKMRIPVITGVMDGTIETEYAAKQEIRELESVEELSLAEIEDQV